MTTTITPEYLMSIYQRGRFPMADNAEDLDFGVYEPDERSILPFENLHVPKSLKKKILKAEFDVCVNTAFADVIEACGQKTSKREETWINPTIKNIFNQLHKMGHAHSVESWKDGKLVGGLYGLQVGSVFCGESMFSRETDASKVALVHLCARLKQTGFTVLDAQLDNPHLDQFGQIIISQDEYLRRLKAGLNDNPDFMKIDISEQQLVSQYLSQLSPA